MQQEFTRTVLEINMYGEKITMRRANRTEHKEYVNKLKALVDGEDTLEVIKEFCVKMGMPAESFDGMELGHINAILDFVLGNDKKK